MIDVVSVTVNSGAWEDIAGSVEDVTVHITRIRVAGYQLNLVRNWLYAQGIEHSVTPAGRDLGIVFRCYRQQLLFEIAWSKYCVQ